MSVRCLKPLSKRRGQSFLSHTASMSKAFHLEPDAPVAVHFAGACRTLGIEPEFGQHFGGSDETR